MPALAEVRMGSKECTGACSFAANSWSQFKFAVANLVGLPGAAAGVGAAAQ